jgi:glutathione S-transferase
MLDAVPHKLYIIYGSHPCVTAERALQLKGQPYVTVEYPPAVHVPAQWLRFRKTTVPALVLGSGEQIVGSRAILHRLDELVAEPPLLPADPAARARVEEAERWGDEVLQPVARRLFWIGVGRNPDAGASYQQGSKLPVPGPLRTLITPTIGRLAVWRSKGSIERASEDVAALPAQLDRVDAWIAEGVLGGPQPNAADLQISTSVRILGTFADVWPLLQGRPSWALAQRLFPSYEGELPAGSLPAAA